MEVHADTRVQETSSAVRYTVEKECLTHYFNILTDGMPDWKLPISGTIPIALLNPYRKDGILHWYGVE